MEITQVSINNGMSYVLPSVGGKNIFISTDAGTSPDQFLPAFWTIQNAVVHRDDRTRVKDLILSLSANDDGRNYSYELNIENGHVRHEMFYVDEDIVLNNQDGQATIFLEDDVLSKSIDKQKTALGTFALFSSLEGNTIPPAIHRLFENIQGWRFVSIDPNAVRSLNAYVDTSDRYDINGKMTASYLCYVSTHHEFLWRHIRKTFNSILPGFHLEEPYVAVDGFVSLRFKSDDGRQFNSTNASETLLYVAGLVSELGLPEGGPLFLGSVDKYIPDWAYSSVIGVLMKSGRQCFIGAKNQYFVNELLQNGLSHKHVLDLGRNISRKPKEENSVGGPIYHL